MFVPCPITTDRDELSIGHPRVSYSLTPVLCHGSMCSVGQGISPGTNPLPSPVVPVSVPPMMECVGPVRV